MKKNPVIDISALKGMLVATVGLEPYTQIFSLRPDTEHIALCDLLHLEGYAESGGIGKQIVAAGLVKVDGVVELRKTCKIKAGQSVQLLETIIEVK